MEQYDRRIPHRPGPSAPPPPRSLPAQQPEHLRPKTKQNTPESIKRSQVKTVVLTIVLIVMLLIIVYLATTLITNEDPGSIDENASQHDYWFTVPDIMSEEVPVKLDVTASDPVEFYLLSEDDFEKDMEVAELRAKAINNNHDQNTKFSFDGELDAGKYVIVSKLKFDEDHESILLKYKISRYVIMPILWIVVLLFIIPISICIVWIVVLQQKKSTLSPRVPRGYERPQYDRPPHARPGPGHYDNEGRHYDDYARPRPPESEGYDRGHDRHGNGHPPMPHPQEHYDRHEDYAHDRPHHPHHGEPDRPRGHDRGTEAYGPERHPREEPPQEPKNLTIPCKCGEVIVISDDTRPLRIKCPRCGRRGILEAKTTSPEDEIFY